MCCRRTVWCMICCPYPSAAVSYPDLYTWCRSEPSTRRTITFDLGKCRLRSNSTYRYLCTMIFLKHSASLTPPPKHNHLHHCTFIFIYQHKLGIYTGVDKLRGKHKILIFVQKKVLKIWAEIISSCRNWLFPYSTASSCNEILRTQMITSLTIITVSKTSYFSFVSLGILDDRHFLIHIIAK